MNCLKTLLKESDSAGLELARKCEAYFSKNDPLTPQGQRTDAQACRGQMNYVILIFVRAYIHAYGIV